MKKLSCYLLLMGLFGCEALGLKKKEDCYTCTVATLYYSTAGKRETQSTEDICGSKEYDRVKGKAGIGTPVTTGGITVNSTTVVDCLKK